MARSEYSEVPDEQAQGDAPDDYQHLQAGPEDFGGQIAKGAENLGSGIIDAEKFYGTVAADNGTNNTLQQVTNILHGDPGRQVPGPDGQMAPDTGYFGKRGADAMAARGDVAHEIDSIIATNRQTLSTPQAQLQYDTDTRRYRAQWLNEIGSHADQQQQVWATDTNNTSAVIALNAIGRNPNDPATVAAQQENVNKAYVRNAQLKGEDPQGAMLKAKQDSTIVRLNALRISDPAAAQQVFDTDGSVLASRPDYDSIARGVKESVINSQIVPATTSAIATAKAAAASRVGVAGQPVDLASAILGQESGGNPSAPTSVNGAVGIGQMKPGTFAQFAKPGEDINKPADNAAVANRAIQHYSQQFNGDTARVAVAYFSGPGNVAPAGSPTPYLHDYKDGNGKSVSSYVGDIQGRTSGRTFPTMADALRGTMDETLTQAQADGQKMFPQYPDAQERYVQGVRRGLEQTISQQDQQYTIDTHIVQQAMASDRPPITEQQLLAMGPQVATAWRNVQINSPYTALNVAHMFDANARGVAKTYGTQLSSFLSRVLAPSGDPQRITASDQLWGNINSQAGERSPLTNTGVSMLTDLMQIRTGPQGEANATQLGAFVKNYHEQQTFLNEIYGLKNEKGEERFNKSMLTILPAITTGLKNGKTMAQMTDPTSPDYVGALGVPLPDLTHKMSEITSATENMGAPPAAQVALDPAKAQMVDAAIKSKQFTTAQGEQLKNLMLNVQARKMTPAQAKAQAQHLGIFPPDVPRPQ